MTSNPSPDTVKNKLSVVRKYVTLSSGDLGGINSIWMKNAVDAIARVKYYKQNIKQPISVKVFRNIVLSKPPTFIGNNIRAMLLMLYFGAFRQSEIAPRTSSSFKKSTNMCKKDITFIRGKMHISLRWAKNQQRWDEQRVLKIPPIKDKRLCPVASLVTVLKDCKGKKPNDPVFVFSDKKPISVNFLRQEWTKCIKDQGLDPKVYSLHSIRKAAASNAYKQGCKPLDVQRFAGWNSNAYLTYIKTSSQKSVNKALTSAIQK